MFNLFLLCERTGEMKYAKLLGLEVLVVALGVAGCGGQGGAGKDPGKGDTGAEKPGGKKKDHAHGKGPNGGVVFDLGKYHAELDIKHPKKELYILILGDDEKTPVAVSAKELTVVTKEAKGKKGEVIKPMTIALKPVDEKDGKASKFVGTDEGLGIEAEHEGTVFGEINGKRSEGKFKEE